MANQATTRKKFKVMTSGATVDGRNVTRAQLHAMAAAYNPAIYGARVNIEHYLSPSPDSVFSAMGMLLLCPLRISTKARWLVRHTFSRRSNPLSA